MGEFIINGGVSEAECQTGAECRIKLARGVVSEAEPQTNGEGSNDVTSFFLKTLLLLFLLF